MKKIKFKYSKLLTFNIILFGLFIVMGQVNATTLSIGVIDGKTNNLDFFDYQGNKLGSNDFDAERYRSLLLWVSSGAIWSADIRNDDGSEWIYYDENLGSSNGNNAEIVIEKQNQNAEKVPNYSPLDGFAAGKEGMSVKLTINNINDNYAGQEILTCDVDNTVPRIKIYSYDETNSGVKIKSFKIFGTNQSNLKGCSGLAIGNIDSDPEKEIITEHNQKDRFVIYDQNGNKETSFNHTQGFDADYNLFAADLDGTGLVSFVFKGTRESNLYVTDPNGETIFSLPWNNVFDSGKKIKDYSVGDIDNDGKDEIIILQTGKKGKIYVVGIDGELEFEFTTYPNATSRSKKNIYVAPFSF